MHNVFLAVTFPGGCLIDRAVLFSSASFTAFLFSHTHGNNALGLAGSDWRIGRPSSADVSAAGEVLFLSVSDYQLQRDPIGSEQGERGF